VLPWHKDCSIALFSASDAWREREHEIYDHIYVYKSEYLRVTLKLCAPTNTADQGAVYL